MTRRPSGREPVASPIWTVDEAAAYMRRERKWVLKHQLALGGIRSSGRLQGFTQAGLDAWIAAHQPRSVPAAVKREPTQLHPAIDLRGLPPTNPLTGERWTVGDAR